MIGNLVRIILIFFRIIPFSICLVLHKITVLQLRLSIGGIQFRVKLFGVFETK